MMCVCHIFTLSLPTSYWKMHYRQKSTSTVPLLLFNWLLTLFVTIRNNTIDSFHNHQKLCNVRWKIYPW